MSGLKMARDGVLIAVVCIVVGILIDKVTTSGGWSTIATSIGGIGHFAGGTLIVVGLIVGLVQIAGGP